MLTETFIIIVVLIIIIPILRKIYKSRKISKNENNNSVKQLSIQKDYEDIVVDLACVKVKLEKFKEITVENQSIEYQLNSLSDTGGNENLKLVKKRINKIVIQIPYKKSHIKYEINTEMDISKLKLFFEVQKQTKAQVYKSNRKIKYIDLSFLR